MRFLRQSLLFFIVCMQVHAVEVRVLQVLGTNRFVLDSGDTVRLAFVKPPFTSNPDTIKRQFAFFVERYISLLTQGDELRAEFLQTTDSSDHSLPVHLYNDLVTPTLWINRLLLESGFVLFSEEADTTRRIACLNASIDASKNKRGLWAKCFEKFGAHIAQVVELYAPGFAFAYHSYQPGFRFSVELGSFYAVSEGEYDRFTFSSSNPYRKLAGYAWPRAEWIGSNFGIMAGAVFVSELGEGFPAGTPIPLWGLRLGNMDLCYFGIDFLLIIPVWMSFHCYTQYPYAQCWIGISSVIENGDDFAYPVGVGLDCPIRKRLLLKIQGLIATDFRHGVFRLGMGYVF